MVELPESCYSVWKWFLDLHNARSSNGFGVNPISYTEIKSYFDLIEIKPEDWELELLKKLDASALAAFAKHAETEKQKQQKK
jgi:hypothetical protein